MGIESRLDTPLAEAVRKVGSQSAFARLVGKSQPAVYQLLAHEHPLWSESVLTVEAATGIPKERLRADLYPSETNEVAALANDLEPRR